VLEHVRVDRMLTIAEGSAPAQGKPMFIYPRVTPPAAKK